MKRRNKLLLYSPAFHPLTNSRRNGDFPEYQYPDYQKINPLDVVKHNVKLLCDFYRLSSITKFSETGIHKHQYFDYQTVNPHETAPRGTWVPEAYTLPRKTITPQLSDADTHASRNTMHGYLQHLLLSFRKFAPHALKGTLDFQGQGSMISKKLDISFQVTRFQMIFGEKEQSVKA